MPSAATPDSGRDFQIDLCLTALRATGAKQMVAIAITRMDLTATELQAAALRRAGGAAADAVPRAGAEGRGPEDRGADPRHVSSDAAGLGASLRRGWLGTRAGLVVPFVDTRAMNDRAGRAGPPSDRAAAEPPSGAAAALGPTVPFPVREDESVRLVSYGIKIELFRASCVERCSMDLSEMRGFPCCVESDSRLGWHNASGIPPLRSPRPATGSRTGASTTGRWLHEERSHSGSTRRWSPAEPRPR